MDTKQRIAELRQERGWSNYELAKRSGLQLPTIQNMYHRNYEPTLPTLQAICKALAYLFANFSRREIWSILRLSSMKRLPSGTD